MLICLVIVDRKRKTGSDREKNETDHNGRIKGVDREIERKVRNGMERSGGRRGSVSAGHVLFGLITGKLRSQTVLIQSSGRIDILPAA